MTVLSDHNIDEEFEEIRASVKTEQAAQASWAQLFRGGLATRRVLLGIMLQTAQQLSGINVLAYYLPVVLHRSVGLPELTARFVAAANAVSFWLTTTASILFVDKVGRRPLLMVGAAIMSVAFFGVGVGVGVGPLWPDSHIPGIIATVFIWLYFSTFSSGWISVPWLYPVSARLGCFRGWALLANSSRPKSTVSACARRVQRSRRLVTGCSTGSSCRAPHQESNIYSGVST